jgi:hypothetical protein
MSAKPQRMLLGRRAGFNLQEASRRLNGLPARRVTRPGPWGNPFAVAEIARQYRLDDAAAQAKAVELCGQWLRGRLDPKLSPGDPPSHEAIRRELKGHNLACWCKPGTPCHSDLLIEIANSP